MLKTPTFIAVFALITAAALVNGAVTQRWTVFNANQALTDKLHALEVRFEDWKSEPIPTEMPTNERSTATSRQYGSPRSHHSAAITFISGIPGSVSTHTPDVCYPGSGYKTLRPARKETLELANGAKVEYYSADFEKKTETKLDRARVRWAWTTDGTWIAPENPRWQFAQRLTSAPVLYKIYVVTPVPEAEGEEGRPEDDAATKAFIRTAWAQFAAAFAR